MRLGVLLEMPEQGQRGGLVGAPGECTGQRLAAGLGVFDLAVGLVEQSRHTVGIHALIVDRATEVEGGALLVEGGALLVEGAVFDAHFMKRRVQRALGDHIDHPARRALAIQHRRRAAQYFDALQVESILLRQGVTAGRHAQAIEVGGWGEATDGQLVQSRGRGATGFRNDSGAVAQDLVKALGVLCAHLVFSDDRNRLRGFNHCGVGLGS